MKKFTLKQIEKALEIADKRMKASDGHSYIMILKTRCDLCGRSPKQKGRCRFWFKTFTNRFIEVFLNWEKDL